MEKGELAAIVRKICINWDLPTVGPPFKERCGLWWELLQDLDIEPVQSAIYEIIATDQPKVPRVGQVRRLALDFLLDDPFPSPAEAWTQLRSAVTGAEAGTSFEKPHDVVGETMRLFPNNGAALRTNGDRELFFTTYKRTIARKEKERYSGGANA